MICFRNIYELGEGGNRDGYSNCHIITPFVMILCASILKAIFKNVIEMHGQSRLVTIYIAVVLAFWEIGDCYGVHLRP